MGYVKVESWCSLIKFYGISVRGMRKVGFRAVICDWGAGRAPGSGSEKWCKNSKFSKCRFPSGECILILGGSIGVYKSGILVQFEKILWNFGSSYAKSWFQGGDPWLAGRRADARFW